MKEAKGNIGLDETKDEERPPPVMKVLSGLYCLLVVAVYAAITANNIANSKEHHHAKIEVAGMLCYMHLVSCTFLLILLCHLARPHLSTRQTRAHGCKFLRQGGIVFGLGSLVYAVLEIHSYFLSDLHAECADWLMTFNSLLAILLILLQLVVFIKHPKMKVAAWGGLAHMGLMHLVASNFIIWMRTVIRESVHEFHQLHRSTAAHMGEGHTTHKPADHHTDHPTVTVSHSAAHLANHTPTVDECLQMYHKHSFVADILNSSSAILYAFIIEFSLVAVVFFYSAWSSVGPSNRDQLKTSVEKKGLSELRKAFQKENRSNSAIGAAAGSLALVFTILEVFMFFTLGSGSKSSADFEYAGKVLNTCLNASGILVSIVALKKTKALKATSTGHDNGFNTFLIILGVFFVFVFSSLTINVGVLVEQKEGHAIPGGVHIANGVVELLAVTLQIVLISLLMTKRSTGAEDNHPGRQEVTFLCFLNFSIWLLDSFELQKSKASLVEAEFYGAVPWIWMLRITLPFCIFFRFHSTVTLVECWKSCYRLEEYEGGLEGPGTQGGTQGTRVEPEDPGETTVVPAGQRKKSVDSRAV